MYDYITFSKLLFLSVHSCTTLLQVLNTSSRVSITDKYNKASSPQTKSVPLAQLVLFISSKWVSSVVMLAHILWTSVLLATDVALLLFLSCTTFIAHVTVQTASYFVDTTT